MTAIQRPGVFVNQSLTPLTSSVSGVPGEGTATFALNYNTGPTLPVLINSWAQFTTLFGDFSASGGSLLHYAVYQFFANGGPACFVMRVPNTDAVVATLGLLDTNGPPDTVMTVSALTPGAWANKVHVEVVASGISGRFNLNVYANGNLVNPAEQYLSASVNPADARYIATMVNSPVAGSNFISVAVTLPSNTYVQGVNDPAPVSSTPLAGGIDGTTAPALGTTVPAALDTLQNQVMYLNLPGVTDPASINAVLTWADGRGDVMVVVDGPPPNLPETSAQVVTNYTNMVTGGSPVSADPNAVIYAPWLLIFDPASTVPGATRFVPPGGAVLAVWDQAVTRYGIQQAPAGTWATVAAVALEANFTATDLNNLRTYQINPVKVIPGQAGFCIFGTTTLGLGYPNRYVPVQRTLIQLTHDMESILASSVFAPDDADLWASVTTKLTTYLTQQMTEDVFAGTTPAEAFSVVCDSTNNTPSSAQAGIVNVTVGVALLSPAEFIVIDLQQLASSAASA